MRRFSVALALALALPLPVLAAEVIVQEGETLSEIAERHGISLTRLMQLNGIRDPDLVEAGRKLTISGGSSARPATGDSTARSGTATITVREGETLSEIAERHGLTVAELMRLNGLSDADTLQVGQTLRLRAGSSAPSAAAAPTNRYPRGASVHVVRSGESLSVIADGYGLSLNRLIALNGLSDPDLVTAGTRLKLTGTPATPVAAARPAPRTTTAAVTSAAVTTPAAAAVRRPSTTSTANPTSGPAVRAATTPAATTAAATPAPRPTTTPAPRPATAAARPTSTATGPDWRTYGPLQVNWAAWQPLGGSMVAPTLNAQGQSLYLAINCTARKINNTAPNGTWQAWSDPSADYEQQLVNDYCRSRGQG